MQVPATILLLDAETGQLNAILGATHLTAARTAAGSAIATQYCLSIYNNIIPYHLVVFGAGLQAELHLECILHLFPSCIEKITIVNRTESRAKELSNKIYKINNSLNISIVSLEDTTEVRETVNTADIIVMSTNSYTPLFDGNWLKPGCHINGVGSFTPQMREVDQNLIDRCKIIIDTKEARDVGDLCNVNNKHIVGLLGDVIADDVIWDVADGEKRLDCTYFKSCGTAIQDILTGDLVVKNARVLGIGTEFNI